ncbi:MAG TPA: carboxypeptidase regulatory-like domain-containing protein [Bryobacteraceae bacterium]|nr:carboxypeptidase regulatory-like domain-containing protein [Bryobacteraceae bacterium]
MLSKAHAETIFLAICMLPSMCARAWCQSPNTAAAPAAYGSIAGIVVNHTTGSPLGKAEVTLSTQEEHPMDALAITDAAGRFAFFNVPPGRYQLHADCDGYQHAWFRAPTPNHPPGIITLHAGEQRQDIVLRLDALGVISGVVVDSDGDPLSRVNVTAWVASFWRGKPKYEQRNSASSTERGEYRIFGLLPGRYLISANGNNQQAFRIQPEVVASNQPGGPRAEPRYGMQFYPGTDRLSAASIVAVAPGKEIEGIDFHMPATATAELRGVIVPPAELPANAQISATLIPQDVIEQDSFGIGVAPPNLSFEHYGLLPGAYLFVASASADARQYRGVQRLEVRPGVQNEVTLKLEPGIDLRGTLQVEGDPSTQRSYRVELVAGDTLPFIGPSPAASVNADGSFLIKGVVPGVWDIGADPIPPGGYIKSMRLGEQDVLTEEMVIGPDTTAPLRIVISTRGGTLEGDVKTGSGEGAGRAIVLLAPAGRFRNVLSFFSVAAADENGHYKMKGLTPGAYRLYAFEAMDSGAWQDPEYLKPFQGLGEPVQIQEGANPSKELRLISGAGGER